MITTATDRQWHILVVDDDPAIRGVVSDILTEEGYAVDVAANGREALLAVTTTPPDLMLLDMRMPGGDGWTLARELRRQGVTFPFVVMTAAQNARRWASEVGANACLAKPFELDHLLATVERFCPRPPSASAGASVLQRQAALLY